MFIKICLFETSVVVLFPAMMACGSGHEEYSCFVLNLLKSTGHMMHQQFNIKKLYTLPTLYLCVLCLSENKQRLMLLTS